MDYKALKMLMFAYYMNLMMKGNQGKKYMTCMHACMPFVVTAWNFIEVLQHASPDCIHAL